ncbi:MAG: hypothetical protein HYS34_00290 [Acidobacteria bacterium]|nr:hypothetical protein [Acidobacteriota bacterium]
MRGLHGVLSRVAVLALFTAGGPALYCAQASARAMPCCKTSTRCDLGMKAAACCTVDPAPGFPERTAGAGIRTAGPGPEKRSQAATLGTPAPAGGPIALALADHLRYPPPRDGSVPLYLRNASILR